MLDREPVKDSAKVGFGKHEGLTYKEVFETQPGYCKWLIQSILKPQPGPFSVASLKLAVYVLNRRNLVLEAAAPSAPEARATPPTPPLEDPRRDISGALGCLVGHEGQPLIFVLSGRAFGGQLTKSNVRALLEFFGGVVRTQVSGRTDYLVLGEDKGSDWSRSGATQQRSSTLKEQRAREHGAETLKFEELLGLIRRRSEGASQDSFALFPLNLGSGSGA